jgi:nicotinamide riboside transporter PnuC
MRKRAVAAGAAALLALLLTALPAFADTEYAASPSSLDWRLVVILSVLGMLAFHVVLERVNRGR